MCSMKFHGEEIIDMDISSFVTRDNVGKWKEKSWATGPLFVSSLNWNWLKSVFDCVNQSGEDNSAHHNLWHENR